MQDPLGAAAEQYRVLRYRLEVLARSGYHALAFTSAQSGEGKTTVAVNTALVLGRGGRHSVALVDADLRRPAVALLLGLRAQTGLCDVVAGRADLDDCLWRFGDEGLSVLPAGVLPNDPSLVLYHPRLGRVIAMLKERFDFVIIDTPPVLGFADVHTVASQLGGALLIVRAGATPRDLVAAAVRSLFGIVVHGIVLNGVDSAALPPATRIAADHLKALPAHRT
jgi:receptor protein-tyrosine kinase